MRHRNGFGSMESHRRYALAGIRHPAFQADDIDQRPVAKEGKEVDIGFVVRDAFGRGCFVRHCAGNPIACVEELRP